MKVFIGNRDSGDMDKIKSMRKDGIEHFQKLVEENDLDTDYKVSECIAIPIFSRPVNGEIFSVFGRKR